MQDKAAIDEKNKVLSDKNIKGKIVTYKNEVKSKDRDSLSKAEKF